MPPQLILNGGIVCGTRASPTALVSTARSAPAPCGWILLELWGMAPKSLMSIVVNIICGEDGGGGHVVMLLRVEGG